MAVVATDQERASACFEALLALAARKNLPMTRTKVAKLLYLADLRSVERTGKLGSGVAWRWRHHGPFDDALLGIERGLVARNKVHSHESQIGDAVRQVNLSAKTDTASLIDCTDFFLEHIEAVLEEWGKCLPWQLKEHTYSTQPMVEAVEHGERNGLLDMGESVEVPDLSHVVARYQKKLDELPPDDDDTPVDNSRQVEDFGVFAGARARATRLQL